MMSKEMKQFMSESSDGAAAPSGKVDDSIRIVEIDANRKYGLTVDVSFLAYTLLGFDFENDIAKVKCQLDFKYSVHDYLKTFPYMVEYGKKNLCASDLRIPYVIANLAAEEIQMESHFVKKSTQEQRNDADNATAVSMYGGADQFYLKSFDPSDTTTTRNLMKCETYSMILDLNYHVTSRFKPFHQIYIFVKLATDGRPGTDKTRFRWDAGDASFQGFTKPLMGYTPKAKPVASEIKIAYNEGDPTGADYPRIYISVVYSHKPWEDVVKFYFIPAMLFVLLVVENLDDAGSLLGLSATLILANIALLFVTVSHTISYQEQMVIINCVMLTLGTLVLSVGKRLYEYEFDTVAPILIGIECFVTACTCVYHYRTAKKHHVHVDKAIRDKNFKALEAI